MIVLGLAGHVDHGKTALVRALTGIDTDRLPEEKARGMTTDLGFAALRLFAPRTSAAEGAAQEATPHARPRTFISQAAANQDPARRDSLPEGSPLDIGVIDVPGHERYIRNMVAGAWSLDLALLVVAADDGWMEQSENHARVLSATGIARLIVAVTKIDKVSRERSEEVEQDSLRRASTIFGAQAIAGVVGISALHGEGIENLKALIAAEAARIEAARLGSPRSREGFLFIDRIFSKPGVGRIVCGSLVGGSFAVEEEVIQSPGGEILRIKGIESLGKAISSISGTARVALNISKAKAGTARGDLLYKAPRNSSQYYSGREFIVKVEELPYSTSPVTKDSEILKKGGEIEAAVGTAGRIGKIIPLGNHPWYRFSCAEELAFPSSSPLVLIRHGGARIVGRAWAVFEGKTDRIARRKLAILLADLGNASPPDAAEAIRAAIAPQPQKDSGGRRGDPILDRVPTEDSNSDQDLTIDDRVVLEPSLKKAEKRLREAGRHCIEYQNTVNANFRTTGKAQTPALPPRKDLDRLCALGIALPLDRNLFIHRDTYTTLVAAILKNRGPGQILEIGTVKEITGFSRKFVIPFLHRMERDAYIKREGERRIILKLV